MFDNEPLASWERKLLRDELLMNLQAANYRAAIEANDRQAAIEVAEYNNEHGGYYDDCPTMLDRSVPWHLVKGK